MTITHIDPEAPTVRAYLPHRDQQPTDVHAHLVQYLRMTDTALELRSDSALSRLRDLIRRALRTNAAADIAAAVDGIKRATWSPSPARSARSARRTTTTTPSPAAARAARYMRTR
jgi:hypothetical protein